MFKIVDAPSKKIDPETLAFFFSDRHSKFGIVEKQYLNSLEIVLFARINPDPIIALSAMQITDKVFDESVYADFYAGNVKHRALIPVALYSDNIAKYGPILKSNKLCYVDTEFALDNEFYQDALKEEAFKISRITSANLGSGHTSYLRFNDGNSEFDHTAMHLDNGDILLCCFISWFNK